MSKRRRNKKKNNKNNVIPAIATADQSSEEANNSMNDEAAAEVNEAESNASEANTLESNVSEESSTEEIEAGSNTESTEGNLDNQLEAVEEDANVQPLEANYDQETMAEVADNTDDANDDDQYFDDFDDDTASYSSNYPDARYFETTESDYMNVPQGEYVGHNQIYEEIEPGDYPENAEYGSDDYYNNDNSNVSDVEPSDIFKDEDLQGISIFQDSVEEAVYYDESEYSEKEYDSNNAKKKSVGDSAFIKWLKRNSIVCTAAGILILIIVASIIIYKTVVKNNDSESASNNYVSSNSASVNEIVVPEEPLAVDEYPEVNEFINRYFTALADNDIATVESMRDGLDSVERTKISVKSTYIEKYDNIVCYTKTGPFENSYIVFVGCDVKLYEFEDLAPSLLTLLVCTNDEGNLYVYTGDTDLNVASYVRTVLTQEDILDLINKVDANYKEVLDNNLELADYINNLNETIKTEIGEVIASENSASQDDTSDETEEDDSSETTEPFEVKAIDTVNVRVSASELADKLGQVSGGSILTCYEQSLNGWSTVEYDGEIGYIKSEFLTVINQAVEANEDDAIGTVSVKETVNVRSAPNTDSEILGKAYEGEEYKVLQEDTDEWTKIIYDGKEAYIKSEYLNNN